MTQKRKPPIDLPRDALVDRQSMLAFLHIGYSKGRELELAGIIPPPIRLTHSVQRYSTSELHKIKEAMLSFDRSISAELLPELVSDLKNTLARFTGAPKNWNTEDLEAALLKVKTTIQRAQRSQPLSEKQQEIKVA